MKYFILVLILLLTGCSQNQSLLIQSDKANELMKQLIALSKNVDNKEAKKLASSSVTYSNQLIQDYELVKPPLFHNFLVNIGVKKRGLCWHFASDMLANSLALHLNSFDYYIGGAHIDDYWQEHNTLVVTCKDCNFSDGIVLDPWRNSGTLFFSKLRDDKEYQWSQRGNKR